MIRATFDQSRREAGLLRRHAPVTLAGVSLAVSMAFLLVGCEAEGSGSPVATEASALEAAFGEAAAAHDVPETVLKAVGFTATRWHHPPSGSTAGLHGIMQLSDEAVADASRLTGLGEDLLREDPRANIHGAAALLGALADRSLAAESRSLPGSWWSVLLDWSGARSHEVAERYAALVMSTLADGALRSFEDGSVLRLSPTPASAPSGIGTLSSAQGGTDYPNATWVAADSSNHSTGRNDTVDRIVLTTAGGSATAAINTFQDPDADRSVHYLVHWDGTVTQLVREENAAWHSSCYNHRSIGIMFEGFLSEPTNYTDEMYDSVVSLVDWITDDRGLDKSATVIVGHSDVDCGDGVQRYAPGEHFDWDRFLATLNGSLMRGEVFFGDDFNVDVLRDDNRIEDALVWLDTGHTTLSSGNRGRFDFLVPPGTYQITAEADGYEPGTRSCDVLAGQDTWCSIMVTEIEDPDPDPEHGTLSGIVVWGEEDENPFHVIANHQDTRYVAGATVTISPGPITVTTGADGYYYAQVDPGTYTIVADADGYEPTEAALGEATVAAGETVYRSVMIVSPPPPAPEITITKPNPGEVFESPDVTVTGQVDHDKPIVTVTVNGQGVGLTGGSFSTTVTIPAGPSTIVVSATDSDGVTGHASVSVVHQEGEPDDTGVDGFVWDSVQGMGFPLQGATIRVGQISTTSESDGWFTMDVGPGTYALRISAEGYVDHVDSVLVPAAGRAELLIALDPEGADVGPEVTILTPQDDALVHEPDLLVEGTIEPADSDIEVTINGVPAHYSAGSFSGVANLTLGSNAIVVEARDGLDRSGTAAITVYYEEEEPEPVMSGVDGFVFDASEGPSSPVAGALVVIGEAEATTDGDGAFSLDVLAGSQDVTITASGFEIYQSTVNVPEATRGTLEAGLTPIDDPGRDDPVIEITFPTEGEVISTATVMVTGLIHDQDVFSVLVNGSEASLGVDGFTAEIALEPGENGIEAIALDDGGTELGRSLVTVHFAGAGTGGCSCASSTGTPSQGALAVLLLAAFGAMRSGRRRS